MEKTQKPIGSPLLWSLIPIGIFASFFGAVTGKRAIEASRSNNKRQLDFRDNSRYD
ncbi:hypothetical protein [Alicyclobacillus fodiniaquatilis]|uniref:Uncharacterized protein n=1 Tax=Alicyclobacillus fodiniaquatilis TaxID=1661150 RepID=A0ABW4JQ53_9BACL